MGKKKANGEGSITKRKDGRYMGRYTVESKRKAVYGDSFEEVRQKLNEILNEIAKGAYVEPNKYSVEKWLREWLELYALPTVKRSTYISYEGYVRIHLVPEIGQIKLTSLSTRDLQKFFKEKAGTEEKKGLAPKTLRNIYNMLHSALDQAVADHKILRNPTLNVKLPKVKSKEMRVLTVEEQAVLQDAVSRVDELHAYGITFAVSTGVRLGELLALRWKDVNEKEHYIYVRRTLGRLQKVDEKGHLVKKEKGTPSTEIVVRSPKSELSMRKIPLFDELWDDLMAYKEKQNALKDALGSEYQDQGYIFATPLGHHNDPKVYQTLFKRIVAAAGIESANFHALRHPYVKHTTKIFSLRLMDFQAQAYPDARRKTRGASQLHRGGQSRSPVRPLCNRKQLSCLLPQSKMSWILYAISMRLSGYTSTRSISSSASSVVSASASKIALDASLRLSCRACSSCFCFACANTAA